MRWWELERDSESWEWDGESWDQLVRVEIMRVNGESWEVARVKGEMVRGGIDIVRVSWWELRWDSKSCWEWEGENWDDIARVESEMVRVGLRWWELGWAGESWEWEGENMDELARVESEKVRWVVWATIPYTTYTTYSQTAMLYLDSLNNRCLRCEYLSWHKHQTLNSHLMWDLWKKKKN